MSATVITVAAAGLRTTRTGTIRRPKRPNPSLESHRQIGGPQ
jgi:hypothetical protein